MTRCALYRHFDADGGLLYVGMSTNPTHRMSNHRTTAHWAERIARMDVEWYDTRPLATEAERIAITNELPMFNRMHTRDDRNPVAAILSQWPARQSIADDLGIELIVVHRWVQRGSIPPKYWLGLLQSAARREIPVTADDLVIAHSESAQ